MKEEAVDKHPEKRMKAAYEAFEKERLPQLKAEKSNMRLSQLKQMMKKEWMKHPDNPLNQRLAAMRNQWTFSLKGTNRDKSVLSQAKISHLIPNIIQ